MKKHVGVLVGGVIAFGLCASNSPAELIFRTIALTGTDGTVGPGLGAGVTFNTIDQQQPAVNNAGQVLFRGNASIAGTPHGVWRQSLGVNTSVATAGGAQPGGGTYTAGTTAIFNGMQLNSAGEWAFRLGGSTGAFGTAGGTPTRMVLGGDAAPGTGGATYASIASGMPLWNDAGQAGYLANLTSGTGTPPVTPTGATANAQGLWTGTPGATALALRQNDPVLALDAGGNVRVGAMQNLSLSMNGAGRFAVTAALQGSVTTGTGAGSNAGIIATNRTGGLEVAARVGSAAPDASGAPHATDLYRSFGTSSVAFNNAGSIAFVSSLRNAAGTQTATSALFTDVGSGTLRMVARQNDAVPAIANANGAEFAGTTWSLVNAPAMNAGGSLALTASLGNTGATNNTGVLLTMSPAGVFSKVARAADVAIIDGAPLGGDAFFTSFSSVVFNSAGQIAFSALLNGNGIAGGPGGNNSALFAYDPAGGLCLLARTRDLFEVAPGDFREISSIGGLASSGGQDGRTRSLSDNGMLAIQLAFSDGSSGVFLTRVPAPGSLGVLGLAGLAGLIAGRRRR